MDNVVDFLRAKAVRSKRVAAQRRAGGGRFEPRRTPQELLDLIREVALDAARRFPSECKEAIRVRQTVWNRSRMALQDTLGFIPQANEVCRQLRRASGKPWGWPFWLQLAFEETKSPAEVLKKLTAEPERRLRKFHIAFALRDAARHLGRPTLSTAEYDQARRELLDREAASGRGSQYARQRLPESGQIITACGSWEVALSLAGLKSLAGGRRRSALSPVVAIAHHFARRGYLPRDRKELLDFAKSEAFALAGFGRTPWRTWIARGRAHIADEPRLPSPPEPNEPPTVWEPIDLGIDLPPRGVRGYPLAVVLEWVARFREWLPAGTSATDRRYREFCHARIDVPSLTVIVSCGGLRLLLAAMSLPDARDRVARGEEQQLLAEARASLGARKGQGGHRLFTHEQVSDAVRRFHAWLPKRTAPTKRRYIEFRAAHPDVPSDDTLDRHGGLRRLLAELDEQGDGSE